MNRPTLRPETAAERLRRALRPWRVRLLLHRRPVAALCAGLALWCTLQVLAPAPEPGVAVLVAARDLDAGSVLRAGDVREVAFAPGTAPPALTESPVGRTVAGPVLTGEALTSARLVTPGLGAHLDGRTGVPVRVPDAAVVRLLRVGDRVDLAATDPRDGTHRRIARAAVVLALPSGSDDAARGRLVLVGVRPGEVDDVAAAAGNDTVQVMWGQPDAN